MTPITAHVDIVPTLIDLCGIPAPNGVRFDGRSIRPLLENKASLDGGTWPDRILVTDSQRVKDPIKWRQSAVMTNRWRLNDGTELYDIQTDPGQKLNVAGQHPQVVARLRDFYENWWAELEPTFSQATPAYLGDDHDNPARLTCHDWITTGLTPWNQSQIRSALSGEENTGFWNVKVVEDGLYEIALRRWPQEADLAIDAELPPGAPVAGERPFRVTRGKAFKAVEVKIQFAGQQLESPVAPGAKEVLFKLHLKAGLTTLSGRFFDTQGDWIGTYYAYVKKL